jgi:nuclear control of ATPase protein 2
LLRSQELTFGFVGVAPSLAVVYIVGGWLRGLWSGGRGRGKYGGKRSRENSFYAIRSVLYFTAVFLNTKPDRQNEY